MRIPKRTTYSLLVSLLALNFILRYPWLPHEAGYDGFIFHGMALSLVNDGYASWILNPLSYLGLYPLSQPSGSVFLLGDLSQLSGVPIEAAIVLLDWMIVAIGMLAAFFLSIAVRRDEGLAVLVAALFSLAPRFVIDLLWAIPTRTLFAALVPLFLLLLLRWYGTRNIRWFGFIITTLVLMMSAHRLTALMATIAIGYVITAILMVFSQTLRIRYGSRVLSRPFRRASNLILLTSFFLVSSILLVVGVLENYTSGRLEFGSGIVLQLSNLAVSLARSVGFLVALVPLGVIVVYRVRGKDFREPFLLVILLVLIPTLSLRQYTGYYIISLTAIFIGMGLWWVVQRLRRRSLRTAVVATAIAITVVSSYLVVGINLELEAYVDDSSYTHGLYVLHRTHGTIVSNDGILGSELFMVSAHPYLPVGGATTAFQSPELLIFGFVNRSQLEIYQLPISSLTLEDDSPFVLKDVQAEADWANILGSPPDAVPQSLLDVYHPQYLAENWGAWGGYTAYGNTYPSPYIVGVHATRYKVFEIGGQTLWYVGGPP